MVYYINMEKQQATNQFINSCLDVNGSWREAFNEISLLWTMDLDIDQGWTIIGECIKENLVEQGLAESEEEISDGEVDGLICAYLHMHDFGWSKEMVQSNEDWAREVVENCGADEDYFDEWLAA